MHDLGPAASEMTRLVNGVRDDQLGDPTPCPRYTLGDLLHHIRGLAEAFALAGRKEQPAGGSKPPPEGDAALLPEDWRAETADWLRRVVEPGPTRQPGRVRPGSRASRRRRPRSVSPLPTS